MTRSEIINAYRFYYNKSAAKLFQAANLPVEKYGRGCYLYDDKGQKYLDFCASYGILGLGYGHPKIQEAMLKQLSEQASVPMGCLPPSATLLLTQLRTILPPQMKGVYLTVSGSEAVEIALRITNSLRSDRHKVVAIKNSYHGKTNGALTVLGQAHLRDPFGIWQIETEFINFNDLEILKKSINQDTLAVIVEPILGGGYISVPSPGYLSEIRKLCDHFEVILIVDEVQTGFGRTGKMFAIEHDGIVPDIMIISKGASGGHVPFAMVALHERLELSVASKCFQQSYFREIDYFSFPIICATASAAISVIKEENLTQQSEDIGYYLLSRLKNIANLYPMFIIEAIGMGLMTGIKVQNGIIENAIWLQMLKRGVITGLSTNTETPHPVLRFFPPLIVSKQEVDEALDALHDSLQELSKMPLFFFKIAQKIFKYQFYLPVKMLQIGVNLLKNIPRIGQRFR